MSDDAVDHVSDDDEQAWLEAQRAAREDTRPRIPEPPPVRLETVGDVSLPAGAGLEAKLEAFYVGLLRFVRRESVLAFAAENHDVHFRLVQKPVERDSVRPVGIWVRHFREVVTELQRTRVEFENVRGLVAGQDAVLLRDPAGNWVTVAEWAEVR